MHAECLIEGAEPYVEVTVRIHQPVERQVLGKSGEPVERLVVAGTPYVSREEAVEHEVCIPSLPGRTACIERAGRRRADLVENGIAAGALVWGWEPLHATVEAWIEEIAPSLRRIQVNVANRLEWDDAEPRRPLLRTFYSTEVVMHSADGAFASLADPPAHLREQSRLCHNEGFWPVPIGEYGDRHTMLASQIRLPDYPQVVPQAGPSPFDSGVPAGERAIAGIPRAA